MKKLNLKAIIPYLLIPALFMGFLYMYMDRGAQTELQYYEIVELFDQGKVTKGELNLTSGLMTYELEGDDKEYKYTVPNVNIFVNDVHDLVRQHNIDNPDKPIEWNYKAGSSNSWLLLDGVETSSDTYSILFKFI